MGAAGLEKIEVDEVELVLPLPVGVALLQLQLLISAICGIAIFTIYNLAWTFVSARLNRSVWGEGAGP
ncbi:MAG: hypothetical protein MJZ45_06205 [Bacteroidales bacterium]|nr:hypothetical protein [Bacteroidales bacterium]